MRIVLLILALFAPLPALALSCMAPTVERSFDKFAAAEEIYVIVHGQVTFDAQLLPKALQADREPPKMTRLPAMFRGKSMGKEGFQQPFEQEVMLEVSCLGPWCGGLRDGENLMAFLRQTKDGYALAIPPCGGSAFSAPKSAQLETVTRCFAQGACE